MLKYIMNIKLKEAGIGDVITFISYLNHRDDIESFNIDFNLEIIEKYFNDPKGYYEFLTEFSDFLLSGNNKIKLERGLETNNWISAWEIYNYYISSNNSIKFIRIPGLNNEDRDKIVLHTKVRSLKRKDYNIIEKELMDILNKSNKKIIILGEKKLIYGKTYRSSDSEIAYSIYDRIIHLLSPDKIIDNTIDDYGGGNSPSFKRLKEDIDIMMRYDNICLGSGGPFQIASCVAPNIISFSSPGVLSDFIDKKNEKLITNPNIFLEKVEKFIRE